MFDLIVEPDINGFVDQPAGDQCEQHGGNEGKSDEGRDQLCPKP